MSPDHFFYKMTWGEVAACLRGLSNRERVEWERVRRIMWAALKPHSKDIKKYRDVMPLPWDDEKKEVERTNVDSLFGYIDENLHENDVDVWD